MAFIIEGSLYSQVCKDCTYPLIHSKIRFFRAEVDRNVFAEIAADTKDTLMQLTAEQYKSLESQFAGEGDLKDDGSFEATLRQYEQGPLRVVAEIHAPDGKEGKPGPAYVYLTTILPNWQGTRDQSAFRFHWTYTIPFPFWCRLLEFWNLWVICGRVSICDVQGEVARGVHVRAMDADVITDDVLGTAVTDADGHFRIYYHTLDFKHTFLSWMGINVETPFGGTLGPDVYFVIDSADGERLLTETRADGKRPGRKDVGHCFCVSLCVKLPVPPIRPPHPIDPIWTKVGTAFTISTAGNPHHFDNDGYADLGGRKYAITGGISLNGQVPDPTLPSCPLYRFRIIRSTLGNTAPANPASDFAVANAAIVGASSGEFGPGLYMDGAQLGTLTKYEFAPVFMATLVPVSMKAEDINSDGWVDVVNAANRALAEENVRRTSLSLPLVSTVLSSYIWSNDGNQLMLLNTGALSIGEAPVPTPTPAAGDDFPNALYYSIPKVAIRFESKDRITGLPRPGDGMTLNAMVVSNAGIVAALVLKNGNVPVSDCVVFTPADEVRAAYTIYHPHLGDASLTAHSADGSYYAWSLAGGIPSPESTWVSNPGNHFTIAHNVPRPGITEASHAGLKLVAQPDHTCTYIVRLHFQLLRHNGVSAENGSHLEKFFFYQF